MWWIFAIASPSFICILKGSATSNSCQSASDRIAAIQSLVWTGLFCSSYFKQHVIDKIGVLYINLIKVWILSFIIILKWLSEIQKGFIVLHQGRCEGFEGGRQVRIHTLVLLVNTISKIILESFEKFRQVFRNITKSFEK